MHRKFYSRALRSYIALLATVFCAGCASTEASAPTTGGNAMHAIILATPSDAERNTLRPSSKGAPLQTGFGREVPTAQRSVVLGKLRWRAVAGGFTTTISVQSTGARSLRVGMRLNKNVAGLECVFRGSSAVPASALVIAAGGDPYWSPVINGDTVWIELKATTTPTSDVVLEVPVVSHIP